MRKQVKIKEVNGKFDVVFLPDCCGDDECSSLMICGEECIASCLTKEAAEAAVWLLSM